MYTEFIFGCSLKSNTPKILIDSLDYLINFDKKPKFENPKTYDETIYNEEYIERKHSEHEIISFLEEHQLYSLFNGCSAYFPAAWTKGNFHYEKYTDCYCISTRANLKNGGIIEDFLEYVKPYILEGSGTGGVYAYVQYEESELPTIYSLEYGKTEVLDPEIVKKYDQKQDLFWKHFSKLYELISPDFKVTEEMLKTKNIDVKNDNAVFLASLDIAIDHICELYKRSQNVI